MKSQHIRAPNQKIRLSQKMCAYIKKLRDRNPLLTFTTTINEVWDVAGRYCSTVASLFS